MVSARLGLVERLKAGNELSALPRQASLTFASAAEGTVPLSASLFRPGVYNLNRFRVSFPSDPFPAQDFHLSSSNFQRLVHVQLEA
jgi:hypothetical protein